MTLKTTKRFAPIHPGEVLEEEFLTPLGLSQYRLAKAIHVPPRRINEIIHGKRGITADTALRLGCFFGNSPGFWMNLQMHYDLEKEKDEIGDKLSREIEPFSWQSAS
jgi:antitoxin HigA-1